MNKWQSPDTIWTSAPMLIGKHEWRIRQYRDPSYGIVMTYEWRKADPSQGTPGMPPDWWYDMSKWPKYNHNDGTYAGCPKTLRKLYDQHKEQLAKNRAAQKAVAIEPKQAALL